MIVILITTFKILFEQVILILCNMLGVVIGTKTVGYLSSRKYIVLLWMDVFTEKKYFNN